MDPVLVSAVVGHKSVELAPEVYDRATQREIREALGPGRQAVATKCATKWVAN